MIVGILKETSGETRVSLLPEGVLQLTKKGVEVWSERNAGLNASASDDEYEQAGAKIKSSNEIAAAADIILTINPPLEDLVIPSSKIIIGAFQPLYNPDLMRSYAAKGLTIFSLDMLPRTTRAQGMDVLSSQANISGYKAVILAANIYPRYFPMFMTAAGTIAPAKVLVIGAGVAGLQAIATARRLGAIVEVFDTRPAVKEEVISLGAKFVEVEGAADASAAGGYAVEQSDEYKRKQQDRIAESIAKTDIVITTAQIPGKKAPVVITATMIDKMRKGSVVIDLAASTGGNTPYTKNNETIERNGIKIIGNSNLPSTMPFDASKLYGKNILNFLQLIINKEGQLSLNWNDDLVKGSCITNNSEVVHERLKNLQTV